MEGGTKLLNSPCSDTAPADKSPRLYKRRWLMILIFTSYSFCNAYQWIHLVIIGDVVQRYYNESMTGTPYQQQVAISWLSMVYMLAYIPLIFPATWLLDRRGLRITALAGNVLNAAGAWLKCGALGPDRFYLLMLGQTVCAIGQVFILGIPARLAAVWFGANEVSTATAIGVFGNQLGCAAGFLLPPIMVPNDPDIDVVGRGLRLMFFTTAGAATALLLLVVIVFKAKPPHPPSRAQFSIVENAAHENYLKSLKSLVSNRGFLLLILTYGINTGSYYAIGTLLNPIILHHFKDSHEDAGRIGLTLVLAGLFGSVIAGVWLDCTKWFKSTTVAIYLMSCASMVLFAFILRLHKIWIVYLCSALLGFFMTGYLPVGFEFGAEITYPESEGTSSGLLNASAQVWGILLTLGMGLILEMGDRDTLPANLTVAGCLLLGTILTILIKSDLRRQKAGQKIMNDELDRLRRSSQPAEEEKVVARV